MPVEQPHPESASRHVIRAVMVSQFLFMAGHSLTSTSGGFVTYFFYQFAPSALALALLKTLPDCAGLLATGARPLARWFGGRKQLWLWSFVAARLVALGVPGVLFWEAGQDSTSPQIYFLVCVALWHLLQGISLIAYMSWLAALVPPPQWGQLFGRRQAAGLVVLLCVPLLANWIKTQWLDDLTGTRETLAYALIHLWGGLICLASIVPLLPLPTASPVDSPAVQPTNARPPSWKTLFAERRYTLLLGHFWWLSFFQGLTQAVLWKFRLSVLGISLGTFLVLDAMMVLIQLPLGLWAGHLASQRRLIPVYALSLVGVSGALLLYSCATPRTWWLLIAAHALFGLFGLINVGLDTWGLEFAPRDQNLLHLAMFRQIGSFLAGIAGVLGGLWLDALIKHSNSPAAGIDFGCRLLMGISFVGRLLAVLWILPLWRDRSTGEEAETPGDQGE